MCTACGRKGPIIWLKVWHERVWPTGGRENAGAGLGRNRIEIKLDWARWEGEAARGRMKILGKW